MLVTVDTGDIHGVDAYRVVVEVDVAAGGMPGYNLVGLPSARVTEGKIRVRAALLNSGYALKSRRVTVNLAPAELRKDTAAFDLPIALGILAAYGEIPPPALESILAVGELALDGTLRPVNGVLPIAALARKLQARLLIAPEGCAAEATVVKGLRVRAARQLAEVVAFLREEGDLPEPAPLPPRSPAHHAVDLAEVRGQETPKRTLEIAAAGGHNLLMVGPPGAGKSMLARRLPTILPPMTFDEALATTKIHSVAGLLNGAGLLAERPFRAPHHTVTQAGLVGGGAALRPGELSLAHNGVLFLDEILEFQRSTLETLRQPLEDRSIVLTRATGSVRFPANVQLVAAMNPCACGHHGDPRRTCTCSDRGVRRYWQRLSGPLLDRIDLHTEVPPLAYDEIRSESSAESSATVSRRVAQARQTQWQRLGPRTVCNARMVPWQVRRLCRLPPAGDQLLETAVERLGLSARAINRVLKVSRTIADLADAPSIEVAHLAEALAYRHLNRQS